MSTRARSLQDRPLAFADDPPRTPAPDAHAKRAGLLCRPVRRSPYCPQAALGGGANPYVPNGTDPFVPWGGLDPLTATTAFSPDPLCTSVIR